MPALRVGFVTDEAHPDLVEDDRPLVAALRVRGVEALPVIWSGGTPAPADLFVLRSPWDYYRRRDEFLAWLLEAEKVAPVLNAPTVVRWNSDKRYLLELEASGVPIVATALVEAPLPTRLADVVQAHGWSGKDLVVKPTISAGAYGAMRVAANALDEAEARFAAARATGALLVQPFVDEVTTDGELSFMFVEGALAHVVRKRPSSGDFRVQEEHGGATERIADPPAAIIAQAAVSLTAAGALTDAAAGILYARVDGVVVDGVFRLMEIELIEPTFYFAHAPETVERFANAVLGRARMCAR
jgi:glutathione synthase/RimK-type ligase-like ATP-grasp enzyme